MDDVQVMERLAAMPVYSWKYDTADGSQHIGPMAQDFYEAFGTGDDEALYFYRGCRWRGAFRYSRFAYDVGRKR